MTAESEAFGARSEIRETVIRALETIAQTQTLMAQVDAGSPGARRLEHNEYDNPGFPDLPIWSVPGLMRTIAPPSNPAPKPQPNPLPHRTVATLVSVDLWSQANRRTAWHPISGAAATPLPTRRRLTCSAFASTLAFSVFLDSASVYGKVYRAMKWQRNST